MEPSNKEFEEIKKKALETLKRIEIRVRERKRTEGIQEAPVLGSHHPAHNTPTPKHSIVTGPKRSRTRKRNKENATEPKPTRDEHRETIRIRALIICSDPLGLEGRLPVWRYTPS